MIENLIFSQLLTNDEYSRRVLPHLKDEYFTDQSEKNFVKIYANFFRKHNKIPSKISMLLEIENLKASADIYTAMKEMVGQTVEFTETIDYLIEQTEKFCKERAIFNALKQSILIVDGQSKTHTVDSIPAILQEALGVCFDTSVGHDYIEDAEARYDYYHMTENRIPTGIPIFDKIMRGGPPRKTLNVLLAPPHGGKSLVMVNMAAGALQAGFNVLYISMEMAAEEIGKRFDCNLMDIDFDTLEVLPKSVFTSKFSKIANSSKGRLIIKQYPTGTAHAGHFRALISELKTKQNFIPDLICVDYMSICASEIYKNVSVQNSYTIVGSIGKELRALAIETDSAMVTAVQTNRGGIGNSDVDMSNTSESMGIPAIADWFAAIITTEELAQLHQLMFKQLKNRYNGLEDDVKFILGVEYAKMKLFQLENSAAMPESKTKKPSKIQTSNDTFGQIDMAHMIKPSVNSFSDFNF